MSQIFDFNKLTNSQLKDELRTRKLKVGGRKAVLIARLMEAGVTNVTDASAQDPSLGQNPTIVQTARRTTQTFSKPKKQPKNPLDALKDVIRSSDLPLSQVLPVVFLVYGLSDDPRVIDVVNSLLEVAASKPVAPPVPTTQQGLSKLKVVDLKKILKSRGQKVGGKKADLIQRILNPTPPNLPAVADTISPLDNIPGAVKFPPQKDDVKENTMTEITETEITPVGSNLPVGNEMDEETVEDEEETVEETEEKETETEETVEYEEEDEEETEEKETSVPTTQEGLSKLTVPDLKKILKSMEQRVGGKKADLIQRILNIVDPQPLPLPIRDEMNEETVEDEDTVEDDEETVENTSDLPLNGEETKTSLPLTGVDIPLLRTGESSPVGLPPTFSTIGTEETKTSLPLIGVDIPLLRTGGPSPVGLVPTF